MTNRRTVILLIANACLLMAGLGGCSPLTLKSIGASPEKVDIYEGYSKPLSILATYSNDKKIDVSNISIYKSSNENVVSVNADGFVFGTGVGEASVSVSFTDGNVTREISIPVAIEPFGGTGTYSGMS